jgi:ribosomal protein L3
MKVIEWEYLLRSAEEEFGCCEGLEEINARLNDLGKEGWELIMEVPGNILVFKRPLVVSGAVSGADGIIVNLKKQIKRSAETEE